MKKTIAVSRFFFREKGQTLILALIFVVILLLAIIFLFDLHSIIRVKVKAQTAADAAALTAANWQMHSLNLIGELNLVKACTVLVSDIPPFGDDTPEGLTESSEILTEMQARVSFVGPLIGVGAAQQAAKNNGMNPVNQYTTMLSNHISELYNDDYYGEEAVPQEVEGYAWRTPYIEMVETIGSVIGQGGVAACPNVEYARLPEVTPEWLMDLQLYYAISAEYWCYWRLRDILKNFSFDGKWWDIEIDENADFPEESEYIPLYVEYTDAGDMEAFASAESYLNELAAERGLTVSDQYDADEPEDTDDINNPFPYLKWCVYKSQWWTEVPSEEWTDATYLRSELKPEYIYGGAVAKMTCEAEPPVVSDSYAVHSLASERLITAQTASSSSVTSSALAKPLGSLGDGLPPYLAVMVLPVFDKVRIIPVAMQNPTGEYDPCDVDLFNLLEFLKWADEVDDLSNPGSSPPAGTEEYLACLQNLNDVTWRSQGYNRSYSETIPTEPYDSETNPSGAGWLQMAYEYEYDGEGEPVAILETNEDTCDDWVEGTGPGQRDGPSVLH